MTLPDTFKISSLCTMILLQVCLGGSSVANAVGSRAYVLAGIVLDHAHRADPGTTTADVKVVDQVIPEEHPGKAYDVIFLVLSGTLSKGHIVTLTSGSTRSCRASLKKFIEGLSPQVVARAYQGARVTRVEDDAAVRELATEWRQIGWLRNCALPAEGDADNFEVLILSDVSE